MYRRFITIECVAEDNIQSSGTRVGKLTKLRRANSASSFEVSRRLKSPVTVKCWQGTLVTASRKIPDRIDSAAAMSPVGGR